QDPGAWRDAAVLLFPGDDVFFLQEEIGIGGSLLAAVDDERGPDEALGLDRVDRVVRQILAGHPVDRRIEVGAGVLAAGKVVPVPGRSALVVARDLFDAE